MFQKIINKAVKPLVNDAYERGYTAGVAAEKLVKEDERIQREYDLLCRGAELERQRILQEMEDTIEELDADEFAELAELERMNEAEKEPFGFVGTLDDLELVLEGEAVQ